MTAICTGNNKKEKLSDINPNVDQPLLIPLPPGFSDLPKALSRYLVCLKSEQRMIHCHFYLLSFQANLENQKKQQGNAITEMFDRLKTENESRKHEIHGLKDILVRENDNRIQETEELRMAMELGKDFHRKIGKRYLVAKIVLTYCEKKMF